MAASLVPNGNTFNDRVNRRRGSYRGGFRCASRRPFLRRSLSVDAQMGCCSAKKACSALAGVGTTGLAVGTRGKRQQQDAREYQA